MPLSRDRDEPDAAQELWSALLPWLRERVGGLRTVLVRLRRVTAVLGVPESDSPSDEAGVDSAVGRDSLGFGVAALVPRDRRGLVGAAWGSSSGGASAPADAGADVSCAALWERDRLLDRRVAVGGWGSGEASAAA
ncbi:MAG: hypothetical protein JXA74_13100 [Anaerolineae bacterium]|nr:hypothetical protein [Anaerolineae bacterium]